jgi:lipopolysaccharide export system protein LptA
MQTHYILRVMFWRILKFLISRSILALSIATLFYSISVYAIVLEDIVIESDDLVVNKSKGTARFTGNVLVWFDDAVLKTTDITLLVKEEGKNRTLEKIIMPAKLTAMKEDEDEIIIADSAEYIATKKLLKFKGNIYMKKDERLVKCDELNYFTAIKGISSVEDKK